MLGSLQYLLMLALALGAAVLTGWALVDCVTRRSTAFVAAGKLDRRVWLLILAVAFAISFVALPPPIGTGRGIGGLLSIASIVAAAVYLTDVRPAVQSSSPRRRGRRGGGRGYGSPDDRPPTAWRS